MNERCQQIGRLLNEGTRNMSEIALEVGVTREYVRQIRKRHFPDAPVVRLQAGSVERYKKVGALLETGAGIVEVAREAGMTPTSIRRLQKTYFPDYHNRAVFRREVLRIIAESGAKYCAVCHQVKDCSEYPPRYLDKRYAVCRQCGNEKQAQYNQTHPGYIARMLENRRQSRAAKKPSRVTALEIYAPEIAKQVRRGVLTLEEALQQFPAPPPVERRFIYVEVGVFGFLAAITEHLSPDEIAQLRERL